MKHVNLNTASDDVRNVILSFSAMSTVFELDGQPIACLVPPPTAPEATFRCVYCLLRETWYPVSFHVDHFLPVSHNILTHSARLATVRLRWPMR